MGDLMAAPRKRDESRLLADIRLAVGARPDFMLTRINTGVFDVGKGAKVRSAPNGFPDLIGTLRCRIKTRRVVESNFSLYEGPEYWHEYGQAVAIETKAPKGRLSEAQIAWGKQFEKVGGVYILARSVEDVLTALGPVPEWTRS